MARTECRSGISAICGLWKLCVSRRAGNEVVCLTHPMNSDMVGVGEQGWERKLGTDEKCAAGWCEGAEKRDGRGSSSQLIFVDAAGLWGPQM